MADPVLKPWEKRAAATSTQKPWEKRAIVNRKGLTGLLGGVEQFGAGLNEGLAGFAGAPVDLMTGALNLGATGINKALGTNIPAIETPVGGGAMMTDAMSPFISDRAPDGMAERFLRRGGQELGFGVPAALTGAAIPGFGAPARASMPAYMGTSVAGDVGAALGGQTAQEIAPGNTTADFFASMLGGGGVGLAAASLTPALAPTPSFDEFKAKNAGKWAEVKASPDMLTPEATARLSPELRDMLQANRATNPNLFPRANATVDDIAALPPKSLYEVEEARRLAGRNVASNADEAAVGVAMKKSIDGYLDGLTPADVTGRDPSATIELMRDARRGTHQVKKAEAVLNKEMRAETRAATTGTGGNEVNATRQNIRALFDKERDPTLSGKRAGFTPDEMAAMEGVVMGDTQSNIARLLGRAAPSSGALPMATMGWGGAGGVAAAAATGNPLMALPAIAGGVGEVSKRMAEGMTKKQIEKLLKTILNDGKAPGMSTSRAAANRALIEQLLSGAASGQPQ